MKYKDLWIAHGGFPVAWARLILAVALAAGIGIFAGRDVCASDDPRPSDEMKEEARKVLGRGANKPSAKGDKKDSASSSQWCIALASLRGPERDEAAPIALTKTQTAGKLPEAYLVRRTNAIVVAYGKYDGPDDPKAQADLKRVQEIVVDGLPPYAFAFLCPPEEEPKVGGSPEHNLLQAKKLYGEKALQTLQVAVYGREDLKNPTEKDLEECRKAAEIACARYRQDGELAFYYHGPRRSMVTIGVFDETDFDPQLKDYHSVRLLETKKRHPYNLYNGAAIRERRPGQKEGRLQASTLVKIPDLPAQATPSSPSGAVPVKPTRP